MLRAARPVHRLLVAVLAALLTLASLGANAWAQQPRPEALDRSTPRRSLEGFLRAGRAGDAERASHFLDLRGTARGKLDGAELASRLALVLDWTLVIDPAKVSDAPDGDPSDGPGSDILGAVPAGDDLVPIALVKTRDEGKDVWLFSRTTVAMVPALYAAHGARWIGGRMPAALRGTVLGVAAWQWIGSLLALAAAWAIGLVVGSLAIRGAMLVARRTKATWDDALVTAAKGPLRLGLGVGAFGVLTGYLHLPATARAVVGPAADILFIIATAWLVIRLIHVGASSLHASLPEDTAGELKSRGIRTQLAVMRRVASIVVGVVAGAAILTQFDVVKSFGTSLLASAGIAGIVLGIAAQKALGSVIGGIQLSITQPLRLGDSVTIENEFGSVEDIHLTFVVIKLWDERRLVVPVTKILENPFQNWTRTSADILGSVMLQVDYTTPIDRLREELDRIVGDNPLWDGRVCRLQVTDTTDRAVVVRALVSAQNADKCFNLRCEVREKLLRFLQDLEQGGFLPRVRWDKGP